MTGSGAPSRRRGATLEVMTTPSPRTDGGLFGPDSISWRVNSDPVALVGGLRALLLQTLQPVSMTIFEHHSSFREDFWGRGRRTADYVNVVTFGTTSEAERMLRRIAGVHRRLAAVPVDGAARRADESELLLWVHVTIVESFLGTTRRAGLRLTGAEADTYVEEQAVLAERLGVDVATIPRSVAEMDDYVARTRPVLRATPAAITGVRTLLLPPMPGAAKVAAPAWSSLTSLAVASLPRWARRMLLLPGLPTTDLATTAALRVLRATITVVPERLRTPPAILAARERLAG